MSDTINAQMLDLLKRIAHAKQTGNEDLCSRELATEAVVLVKRLAPKDWLPLKVDRIYLDGMTRYVRIRGETRFPDIVYDARGDWYFTATGRRVNYTMDGAQTREPFPDDYPGNIIGVPDET